MSNAVDQSAVARTVGIQTVVSNLQAGRTAFLPQRIAVVGQGATAATYATTKAQVFSALEVGQNYGFGSPLHLAVKQLLPNNGDGVGTIPVTVYPLDDDGSGVVAVGDITPTGTATAAASFKVRIGGILSGGISIASGANVAAVVAAIVAAINAELDMPVIAVDTTSTVVTLTSKWKGASANSIEIEVAGEAPAGITLALTQPVNGAVNPDVQGALDQFGDIWETMVLNCMEIVDSTTLGLYQVFGETRWDPLVRKPLVVFTGSTPTLVGDITAVTDPRTGDRVNAALVGPGSLDLPLMVAARQLARIAVLANGNPPHDYGGQIASGLNPGLDGDQWTYLERDTAVKAGSSTIRVKGGEIVIDDVVTMYHPAGDPNPAYRFVVDIVKLQNIHYSMGLTFDTAEWNGAPMVPNDQSVSNRSAKQPKAAVAAMAAILDGLGQAAIISNPEIAKANATAVIDGSNPKRLNLGMTVQLGGNTNIISADLNFGFFFGG